MTELKKGINNDEIVKTTTDITEDHNYAVMIGSADITSERQKTDNNCQPGY